MAWHDAGLFALLHDNMCLRLKNLAQHTIHTGARSLRSSRCKQTLSSQPAWEAAASRCALGIKPLHLVLSGMLYTVLSSLTGTSSASLLLLQSRGRGPPQSMVQA